MNGPIMCDWCQNAFATAAAYSIGHRGGTCADEALMKARGLRCSRFGVWSLPAKSDMTVPAPVLDGEERT
jgi:hypothetical protein